MRKIIFILTMMFLPIFAMAQDYPSNTSSANNITSVTTSSATSSDDSVYSEEAGKQSFTAIVIAFVILLIPAWYIAYIPAVILTCPLAMFLSGSGEDPVFMRFVIRAIFCIVIAGYCSVIVGAIGLALIK